MYYKICSKNTVFVRVAHSKIGQLEFSWESTGSEGEHWREMIQVSYPDIGRLPWQPWYSLITMATKINLNFRWQLATIIIIDTSSYNIVKRSALIEMMYKFISWILLKTGIRSCFIYYFIYIQMISSDQEVPKSHFIRHRNRKWSLKTETGIKTGIFQTTKNTEFLQRMCSELYFLYSWGNTVKMIVKHSWKLAAEVPKLIKIIEF